MVSTPLQVAEYDITSTSSLSVDSVLKLQEGLNGQWLSASAALLEWPVWYLMVKSNNASSLSHWICNAPSYSLEHRQADCYLCKLGTMSLINIF